LNTSMSTKLTTNSNPKNFSTMPASRNISTASSAVKLPSAKMLMSRHENKSHLKSPKKRQLTSVLTLDEEGSLVSRTTELANMKPAFVQSQNSFDGQATQTFEHIPQRQTKISEIETDLVKLQDDDESDSISPETRKSITDRVKVMLGLSLNKSMS
jgi:uncharacterized coiled-coil DUF342 family protein